MSGAAIAAAARFAGGAPDPIDGLDAVAEITASGSTSTIQIIGGQVVDVEPAGEPTVSVTFSPTQLAALADGTGTPSQDYMRGDLKPEGSVRAAAALFHVLEREDTRSALASALAAEG